MNLAQVAQRVGGVLHGEALPVTGVSIDTRTLQPGDLFVAIGGERFDGHDFLAAAKDAGASAAVASRQGRSRSGRMSPLSGASSATMISAIWIVTG